MESLLTVEQLAQWLQVKPRTIYQWIHDEYVPVIKLGTLVRFSPARVETWLKSREAPGRKSRRLDTD